MTIGRKLASGFGFLLVMLIAVGTVVYVLNDIVLGKAREMSHDDVPGAILSLSLLDEIGDMNSNVLEYITGEAEEKEDFAQNRQEFRDFFEELKPLETKENERKIMRRIEYLFTKYVETIEEHVFAHYDPEIEAWAIQQAKNIERDYGEILEQLLEQASQAEMQDSLKSTDMQEVVNDDFPGIFLYLSLVNEAGDLLSDLSEYVTGEADEKQDFIDNTMEFEDFFAQLKPLERKKHEVENLKQIYILYRQIKKGAEDIFERYHPENKNNAVETVEKLEHEVLNELEDILDKLAHEEKRDALTATDEVISILKDMTYAMLAVIIFAIIVGTIVSINLARTISIPLATIARGAQHLANGDMNSVEREKMQKIIDRGDEVSEIGKAFDALTTYFKVVIKDIVNISQGLADGNLQASPQAEYRGDFAQIHQALTTALNDQRKVMDDLIYISQGLADGNLNVKPQTTYRGDFIEIKTALENALFNLREVIEDIVHVSKGLAEGTDDVTPQATYRGDVTQIKDALEMAALKLSETASQNAAQNWLKTGQSQLNELLTGEQNFQRLAKNSISFLTTYIDAQVGLFYLLQEANNTEVSPEKLKNQPYLELIDSYAYTASDNRPSTFLIGEGLVGQAALECKLITFTRRLEECVPIMQSGLADMLPNHVTIVPFLYENQVKGVIEIGSTHALSNIKRNFLEQVVSNIGIAVNTAESRNQMQILLDRSQQQAEELQAQQEELRLQNDELQNQSEELQSQQEELREANVSLEERTSQLEEQKKDVQQKNTALEYSQKEMEQARQAIELKAKELELASRYKSEFLANMSHELRTPLNSLLILSKILSENKAGNLDDKQIEYAQTIYSAGSDLLTLINEILDLAKVESGKMQANIEPIVLSDLLDQLELKFRPIAEERQLNFYIDVAIDMPDQLQTDGQRLKQIINNLLSNALKFTEQGEVELVIQRPERDEIAHKPDWDADEMLAIRVKDTGIGIPQQKQGLVFEAFQQVDGATNRKYNGTGLGLSISRQLAYLLGGELKLVSEEGKGSTFSLIIKQTLEAIQQQTSALGTVVSTATAQDLMPSSSEQLSSLTCEVVYSEDEIYKDDRANLSKQEKTLLIIEDDESFADILLELAHEKGFKCLVASDGRMGLRLIEDYSPSAIILDIGLPELDGWTVMDILKSDVQTRHIPIHVISGAEHNASDVQKRGAVGYSHKPMDMQQLSDVFNMIERCITKHGNQVLVITDNLQHQQNIESTIHSKNIKTQVKSNQVDTLHALEKAEFDCVILDMDTASSDAILLQLQVLESNLPVIAYVENRELTAEEVQLIDSCTDNLALKPVTSQQHLLDDITLFLHHLTEDLTDSQRDMLSLEHDKEAIFADKKVLIVDDDIRNSFALTIVLEEKGMDVSVAMNGEEALEFLEQESDIDIILMDIMMPQMDGYEAIERIRQQAQFQHLPIIALTAKAMKGDKAKCINAGANDYMAKPVDTDKLLSLMRVWLYQ
ncbi:response regulator [Candidatus Albibeggiatoa sp. nov. NOAA]|uniref:response regulator n=1 Tax=Candidatus Albibeggiatoa sp. nov. NOAA TaxID=3162724 RepID=UPI0032F9DDDC|nr:response regulator [Thiotrichaceae bacterium]